VKYFFIGAMPELMSRREGSLWGTSGKEGRRRCPLDSKKERYFSRRSFRLVHSMIFYAFLVVKIPYLYICVPDVRHGS
jgi:hypothetical protein